MDIISDIFRTRGYYTAQYGWQENYSDDTFTFGYIASYKDAADILVEEMIPDLSIFPIMFCYRQYLELVLKNICYVNMDKNSYLNLIRKASHNLLDVWKEAKVFLKNKNTKDQLDIIYKIVVIFNELDPNSFNFRYEFDRKLKRSLKIENLEINTLSLKKYMDKVDLYLRYTYDSI